MCHVKLEEYLIIIRRKINENRNVNTIKITKIFSFVNSTLPHVNFTNPSQSAYSIIKILNNLKWVHTRYRFHTFYSFKNQQFCSMLKTFEYTFVNCAKITVTYVIASWGKSRYYIYVPAGSVRVNKNKYNAILYNYLYLKYHIPLITDSLLWLFSFF